MAISFGKRSILGLVAGALMTLGVAAPAFASAPATTGGGTVLVTASNQPSLSFTIVAGNTVTFNPLDPAVPCLAANNGSQFLIKSNRSYTGTVKALAAGGGSDIPVTQLFWSHSPVAATCASTAFSTTASSWTNGSATLGDTINDTLAIQTLYTNTDGAVSITLTYAVTQ